MAKKTFAASFNGLPRLVQILLLLIPVVNWVVEILVRWSSAINRKSIISLVVAILVTFFGLGFGRRSEFDLVACLAVPDSYVADISVNVLNIRHFEGIAAGVAAVFLFQR